MVRAIYPGNTSWRVLKDMYKRQMVAEHEPTRQALRYIVRNTTLPPKVRMKAQLQLNAMPISTRTTAVQNRCVETGRARGVFRDFRLARFPFRLKALAGLLPGVNLVVDPRQSFGYHLVSAAYTGEESA